jgi:hypothetical protein
MVARSERRLVAPSQSELYGVVAGLLSDANGAAVVNLLQSLPGFDQWDASRAPVPEGWRQWNATWNCRSHPRTVFALVWWTDSRGRIHYLALANRGYWNEADLRSIFVACTGKIPVGIPFPTPLELIYPATMFVSTRREAFRSTSRLLCGCGAVGTTESLGWMGECCSSCYDRALEGLTPSQPPCVRTGPYRSGLGWSPAVSAGAQFLAVAGDHYVSLCERESCQFLGGIRLEGRLWDLKFHPSRPWLATAARGKDSLLLWDVASLQVRTRFEKAHNMDTIQFSADGSLVQARNNGRLVWDVDTGKRLAAELAEEMEQQFAVTPVEALCADVTVANRGLAVSADSRFVAMVHEGGWMELWPADAFARLWS